MIESNVGESRRQHLQSNLCELHATCYVQQLRQRPRNEGIEASDVTPTSEMEGQLDAMMASSDFSPIKEARPASSMLGLHDNLRETSCVSLVVFRMWLSPKYETSSNTRLVSMGSAAKVDSLRRCTSSDQKRVTRFVSFDKVSFGHSEDSCTYVSVSCKHSSPCSDERGVILQMLLRLLSLSVFSVLRDAKAEILEIL